MNYPSDHNGIERAHGTVYDRPKAMKPTTRKLTPFKWSARAKRLAAEARATTRKRMPALTPDEARCLRILKRKPTTRKPHPITTALKEHDKIMVRKRTSLPDRNTIENYGHSMGRLMRQEVDLRRLIARWRRERPGCQARQCADELERLLKGKP